MGIKAPFLVFIFCSIPIGVVRAGIPPFQLTQATSRPKRPENLTPDEKVKILFERGNPVAAVLQFIENIYYSHQNGSCRKTSLADFSSNGFEWHLPSKFTNTFEKQMKSAVKTANILNHYFLKAPNDTEINHLFFYSLVKANVESDPSLTSSSIVLTSDSGDFFIPFTNRRNDGSIRTQNLGSSSLDRWSGNDWFWVLETGNYSELFGQVGNGTDLVVTTEDGYWTSPYIDCNFTTKWQITYSVPFFTRNADELYFKGVVAVSLPFSGVDIDQCDGDSHFSAFSSSHHCDFSTTQCVPTSGKGFRRGAYRCYCKPNFYQASADTQRRDYYDGEVIEEAFVENVLNEQNKFSNNFQCLPCRVGCDVCFGDQPCYVEYDLMLRSVVLCFQSFCSTLVVILIIVIFVLRKSPIFSSVMWLMHEAILIGALLLYQTVIIRYFEPTIFTCMIEPWFRGLGFAICYGSIVLKIYRILAEFQTRKAHRVCVRDKDLLKYLLGIITVVIGYLLAWTAVIIDNMTEGYSVIVHEQTSTGLKYDMCRGLWWDYVTEVGELLFLVFGVFLTYKVRNAKSDVLHEKEVLCWSVYIEALVSLLMYTIRHVVWSNLLPDYIYLLYFLRCQCTVTIILFFIFAPKLWYHARPPEEYQTGRQLSSCGDVRDVPEAVKLQEGVQCTANGEIDVSEVNFADMDPEEIRNELRKLYTQLHNMKQVSMRKGNPHISRRRGGRKGTHRKFSLQTFHHRHKQSQHDQEVTEISKTPEESVASADGTTDNASIRQLDESHNNAGTPTVTFKDDQK
ncbi:metabotropic glycine receptor [Parasteatoda tepidariorum]|uniref:metabotropic glycine receptor n=1 Tax=Parasteatoda tepidariorum TaxID=114398 RepID=UPI00077FBED5|nr:probable G-protein coupled receptor 158 [Parasteatoda tepidariorum]